MNEQELTSTMTLIRKGLERFTISSVPTDYEILKSFPKACCGISSKIAMKYLVDIIGINSSDLFLIANVSLPSDDPEQPYSHAWFRYDKWHVDLTADQFKEYKKPKVIISSKSPWDVEYKECSYPEMSDPEYLEMLNMMCLFIKETNEQSPPR